MPIADEFLPEFDHEIATARRVIARVPDAKLGWRPHPRSWTARELATHVAQLPVWAVLTMEQDELDLASPAMAAFRAPTLDTAAEIAALLDGNAAKAKAAIAASSDARLREKWTLKKPDGSTRTLPRWRVLRSFVLSHLIHHRGALTVYLRLLDAPVPSVYGPTADEGI